MSRRPDRLQSLPAYRKPAPFRPFFLIASLDAIAGAGVWLVAAFEPGGFSAPDAAIWHRGALLFGTIPAMLAGFLLTALPRWTGRPAVASGMLALLVGLWLAGRAASLLSAPAGLLLAALFMVSVTGIAAADVLAARDRRNRKIVFLLLGLSSSAALTAVGWNADFALRAGLASITGLLTVIGGRVVPALSAAWLLTSGTEPGMRRPPLAEHLAATAVFLSLAGWVVAPGTKTTGVLCAAASVGLFIRLFAWRGWRVRRNWSILVLHVGYCWIAVGFGLLAIHILIPKLLGEAAAVHAWTVGAFGTLGIAVMSSMVRKHARRPFSRTAPASAAYAAITLSCVTRLLAESPMDQLAPWATLSAALWVVSFALFLAAFGSDLVPVERRANRWPGS